MIKLQNIQISKKEKYVFSVSQIVQRLLLSKNLIYDESLNLFESFLKTQVREQEKFVRINELSLNNLKLIIDLLQNCFTQIRFFNNLTNSYDRTFVSKSTNDKYSFTINHETKLGIRKNTLNHPRNTNIFTMIQNQSKGNLKDSKNLNNLQKSPLKRSIIKLLPLLKNKRIKKKTSEIIDAYSLKLWRPRRVSAVNSKNINEIKPKKRKRTTLRIDCDLLNLSIDGKRNNYENAGINTKRMISKIEANTQTNKKEKNLNITANQPLNINHRSYNRGPININFRLSPLRRISLANREEFLHIHNNSSLNRLPTEEY